MTEKPPEQPYDVPEGKAQVLMSVTMFVAWAKDHGVEIVDWGKPQPMPLQGELYEPVLLLKKP